MIRLRRSVLPQAILIGVLWAVIAQAADQGARILRVDRRVERGGRVHKGVDLTNRRLPLFRDEAPAGRREVFEVYWAPPAGGLEPGAVLQFEYVQAGSDVPQVLTIQYPFKVAGERKATFVISEEALRRGGDVKVWRVRLMHGSRTLAGRASEFWSAK